MKSDLYGHYMDIGISSLIGFAGFYVFWTCFKAVSIGEITIGRFEQTRFFLEREPGLFWAALVGQILMAVMAIAVAGHLMPKQLQRIRDALSAKSK